MSGSYLRIRRLVDRDLIDSHRPFSIILPMIVGMFVAAPFGSNASERLWAFAIAQILLLPWYLFVGWRFSRLCRAASLRSARQYEREGRYKLPLEYADSESAAMARRRKKRAFGSRMRR